MRPRLVAAMLLLCALGPTTALAGPDGTIRVFLVSPDTGEVDSSCRGSTNFAGQLGWDKICPTTCACA